MADETNSVMSWPEVAKYLGRDRSNGTWLKLQAEGIPCFRTSERGHWRFRKTEVDKWLAEKNPMKHTTASVIEKLDAVVQELKERGCTDEDIVSYVKVRVMVFTR